LFLISCSSEDPLEIKCKDEENRAIDSALYQYPNDYSNAAHAGNIAKSECLLTSKNEQKIELTPTVSVEKELDDYSKNLIDSTKGTLFEPEIIRTESNIFVIKFKTSDTNLMTDKNADGEGNAKQKKAYYKNLSITAVWDTKFCTHALTEIIKKHKLLFISGQIFDKNGVNQTMSLCSKNKI
jgi:hypothetical protein